jgi:futalosine hydrolase
MSKKILIVAATQQEVAQTFDYFGWVKSQFIQSTQYDVLITGVGMTATAFALGQRLNTNYNLVLNVGIAGSFDRSIPLGVLVNITTDTFSELGAEDGDKFISIDELGFGQGLFSSSFIANTELISALPVVNGITVNTVHGNTVQIDNLLKRLQVQTESMEGAAVFYACQQANIPALQVRSISNYVERRNKAAWQIGPAIQNLNEWLIRFINQIA